MRRLYNLVRPLELYGERGGSRIMKKGEQLWAETPLDPLRVVVYLDNLEFWAHHAEFLEATRPVRNDS